jgi:hypothetical protein
MSELFKRLAAPFSPDLVQWKPQTFSEDKNKALAVAYLDARNIMDRLDEVLGPTNWQVHYSFEGNTIVCVLYFRNPDMEDEWLNRVGVSGKEDDANGPAGQATVSFKRAAVQLGIGRYLYGLKNQWVKAEKRGKNVYLKETPKLPSDMLPEGFTYGRSAARSEQSTEAKPDKVKVEPTPAKAKAKAETKNGSAPADRAKSYVIPTGLDLPFEGETLGEVMGDAALGEDVIKFLAGLAPSPAGRTFEPSTEEQEKVKAAALFLVKENGWS